MNIVKRDSLPELEAAPPTRGRRAVAKVVTAAVLASFVVLGLQETASAESGTQRFHMTYSGPFTFADPPDRRVTAAGPIQGKGYQEFISEVPAPEPNTFVGTAELVFPEGSVFVTLTSTGEFRFNEHACRGFNTGWGVWTITGGTGAYAGATGEGTYEGRNTLSAERTPDGCPAEPDRLVSNLKLEGTSTVPG